MTLSTTCILVYIYAAVGDLHSVMPLVPQQSQPALYPYQSGLGTPKGDSSISNILSYVATCSISSDSIVVTHCRSTIHPTDPLHYQGNANWLHSSSAKDYGSTIYHSDSSSSTICR